jgi:hypothetical protein
MDRLIVRQRINRIDYYRPYKSELIKYLVGDVN